ESVIPLLVSLASPIGIEWSGIVTAVDQRDIFIGNRHPKLLLKLSGNFGQRARMADGQHDFTILSICNRGEQDNYDDRKSDAHEGSMEQLCHRSNSPAGRVRAYWADWDGAGDTDGCVV